jgi:glutathione synthase/RimK-type ligase-like ATP-grasp enzyme
MYHGALSPANTAPMLDALDAAGTFVINGRKAWETMTDKWRFFQEMKAAGVRTIPTRLVETPAQADDALQRFGGAAVFKKPVSTEGDDVYTVTAPEQLHDEVASRLDELGGRVIAQPFVESKIGDNLEAPIMDALVATKLGDAPPTAQNLAAVREQVLGLRNDFRIMTVRNADSSPSVLATFHRVAADPEQTVNNVAKGASAVKVDFTDLDPRDQKTVLEAVDALPDGQIVGWDLIGQPGERYIMEGNSGPGLPTMAEGFAPDKLLKPYADLARAGAQRARNH